MAAGAVNLRTCRWQPQQRCAAGPAYRVCSPCSLVANSSQRGELCVTRGLYSFGSTTPSEEREQLFEGRVPRKVFRRKADELTTIVRGLTSMSSKQLAGVSHLLPDGALDAVAVAARLARSNQGRRRQEALVAKMLRVELREDQTHKLLEAVNLAAKHNNIYSDSEAGTMTQRWIQGLLSNDQDVASEVYSYPSTWAPDHAQLRLLVRQVQDQQAKVVLEADDGESPHSTAPRELQALTQRLQKLLSPLAVNVVKNDI